MEQQLKGLSKESLRKIVLKMTALLSEEQYLELEDIVAAYSTEKQENSPRQPRMSQELVDDKMQQLRNWMKQIDEGDLFLHTEEYEDYSSGYWDREWITEYYDNHGIGDIITFAIRFAKDCVEDYRYQDANYIYEWLWELYISTDCDYDDNGADLETLAHSGIIQIDLEQVALLTLYTDYQAETRKTGGRYVSLFFYELI